MFTALPVLCNDRKLSANVYPAMRHNFAVKA